MKIFGKNGKFNVIDLLLVILILAVIVVGVVGLGILRDKGDNAAKSDVATTEPTFRMTVLCENVDPGMAENIIASLESEPVEVGGVMTEMTRLFFSNKMANGHLVQWSTEASEEGVDLYLTLEAVPDVGAGAYLLGGQEVRIGKSFIVKTLGIEISGNIYTMEHIQ